MSRVGVIDLGSNSVRLVVYEVRDDRGKRVTKKDFSTLVDMKKMAGLSAYVDDGVFTGQGIEKAARIVSRHLKRAHNVGCDDVQVFATAVLRNCANSARAVSAIEDITGKAVCLLSGEEEAHLGFVGARCSRTIDDGTLVDIGGGSTELTCVRHGKDTRRASLDQGSVSSYAQLVELVLPTASEQAAIERALSRRLDALESLEPFRSPILYGIGGSIRAVAKMIGATRSQLDAPKRIELREVEELLGLLNKQPGAFAHVASKAVADRLHTVGCGLAMVRLLMAALEAERIEICSYGLREGFLIERILQKP